VDKRPLALGEQCVGEVVEGAPTAVAPVAFDPWPVVVIAPRTDVLTLATGTLEQAICPPKRMEIGVAGIDVEALVEMGEHRPDGESPLVTRSILEQIGRFSLFITLYRSTNSDKLSDRAYDVEWDAERISKRFYDPKWDVCAPEVPSGPSKWERF
jgi:hypothetical protein